MITKTLRNSFMLVAACATGVAAQEQDTAHSDCPNTAVERVPMELRTPVLVACGSNLILNVAGVTYRSPKQVCPLLVIVTPPHDTTKHDPQSHTFTEPAGSVATTAYRYRCKGIFFGIFGSECVYEGHDVLGRITCYSQGTCNR